MATSTFVMPAFGSVEFTELMDKWSERTITFGQCGMLKSKIRNSAELLSQLTKAEQKEIARISQRDENGRWVILRSDSPVLNYTMADAAILAAKLDSLHAGNSPVTISQTAPKAASVPESHFSEVDEMKIASLMELQDFSRSDAIANLVKRGKIAIASKSETIVTPPVGIYETTEGFRFEVYLVNVKGGGQAKRSRIL
jgi:hypothetical protein